MSAFRELPAADEPPSNAPEPTPADVRLFTRTLLVVGLIALVIVGGTIAWRRERDAAARRPDRARILADFRLTERSGRTVERRDLEGKTLIVNFVFTGCSWSCFEISRRLTEVQSRLGGRPDVRLISITVDPRSDTPEVLSKFATRLKADPERWWFLTGEKGDVFGLIGSSFLTPAEAATAPGGALLEGMPADFEHAERIALVDRAGRVRCFFNGLKPRVADEILEAVEEFAGKGTP